MIRSSWGWWCLAKRWMPWWSCVCGPSNVLLHELAIYCDSTYIHTYERNSYFCEKKIAFRAYSFWPNGQQCRSDKEIQLRKSRLIVKSERFWWTLSPMLLLVCCPTIWGHNKHYLIYFLVVSKVDYSSTMTISLARPCCEPTDCPIPVGLVGVRQFPPPSRTDFFSWNWEAWYNVHTRQESQMLHTISDLMQREWSRLPLSAYPNTKIDNYEKIVTWKRFRWFWSIQICNGGCILLYGTNLNSPNSILEYFYSCVLCVTALGLYVPYITRCQLCFSDVKFWGDFRHSPMHLRYICCSTRIYSQYSGAIDTGSYTMWDLTDTGT